MKFNVTIKMEYKSGRYRTIGWVENDPKFVVVEGDEQVKRPATIVELKAAVSESLYKLIEANSIRNFEDNLTGKSIIVRFEDVSEIEIDIKESEENAISSDVCTN